MLKVNVLETFLLVRDYAWHFLLCVTSLIFWFTEFAWLLFFWQLLFICGIFFWYKYTCRIIFFKVTPPRLKNQIIHLPRCSNYSELLENKKKYMVAISILVFILYHILIRSQALHIYYILVGFSYIYQHKFFFLNLQFSNKLRMKLR